MKQHILGFTFFLAAVSTAYGDAPRQAANLEIQNIATAMELFYFDYNDFTTIENLDDSFSTTVNPEYQRINDGGGALQINPTTGLVRREFLVQGSFAGPPYLTRSSGNEYEGSNGDYDEGTPLDLWLNPYYFYTPLGLVEPTTGDLSLRYYGDDFDLYTIVSHGPDGQPGGGDDLFEQIAITVTATTVSSAKASPQTSRVGLPWTVAIKGYNLGASQGSGRVLVDGKAGAAVVTSWSPTLVTAELPALPAEGTPIWLETGSGTVTRQVELIHTEQALTAENWHLYR